jgi:hypothetical protein
MTRNPRKLAGKSTPRSTKARVSEPRRSPSALQMGDLEIEFEFEIPHVEGRA